MTRQEMMKRYEELENREFMYEMIDRMTWRDREELEEIRKEMREIKRKLN